MKDEEEKERKKEQEDESRVGEVTRDNIEKQRLMNQEAKKGIELFHKNPTKGIA
jgi:hypothetical protein